MQHISEVTMGTEKYLSLPIVKNFIEKQIKYGSEEEAQSYALLIKKIMDEKNFFDLINLLTRRISIQENYFLKKMALI